MTVSWALTSCLLIAVVLLLRFALGENQRPAAVRPVVGGAGAAADAGAAHHCACRHVSFCQPGGGLHSHPVSGGTPVLNFENNEVTGAGELPATSPSSGISGEAVNTGSSHFRPRFLKSCWGSGRPAPAPYSWPFYSPTSALPGVCGGSGGRWRRWRAGFRCIRPMACPRPASSACSGPPSI